MASLTDESRQRLNELRTKKSRQRLWALRRQLLLLLTLVGLTASFQTTV